MFVFVNFLFKKKHAKCSKSKLAAGEIKRNPTEVTHVESHSSVPNSFKTTFLVFEIICG